MDVIVQVDEEVQESLQSLMPRETGGKEILQITRRFNVTLEPLHPGNKDPTLSQYFRVQVEDVQMGETIAAEIREAKGVKSAYVQPHDAEP